MKLAYKFLIFFLFVGYNSAYSQSESKRNKWQLLDPDSGTYVGTATATAYESLLSGKTSTPIIVAVMDGGTDTEHPDLKSSIWTNPGEIPNNGIDDDHNGYIDDIHGWSFIGGKNGDVDHDNTEITRLYKGGKSALPSQYKWKDIKKYYKRELKTANKQIDQVKDFVDLLDGIKASSKHDTVTVEDVQNYPASGLRTKLIKSAIASSMERGLTFEYFYDAAHEGIDEMQNEVKYHLNPDYESRQIVGDNYKDINEKYYGNNTVKGPEALHGTHVAGIIAATRNNQLGMDGIADNAKIMVIRVVPDGDERDKDVANGIRYAVDNGARLINMSFGKPFSPNKEVVDEAVKYAESKGVIIVHGSGNESLDIDYDIANPNFPNPYLGKEKIRANNWIEVGASDLRGGAAYFSNYGKTHVDIFAPGVSIYSTVADSAYKSEDGTSMASPVVCGVAALVWSYYPNLTPQQLKTAILSSVDVRTTPTPLPGNRKKSVGFDTLSSSGGIVNAKKALMKAEELSSSKQ